MSEDARLARLESLAHAVPGVDRAVALHTYRLRRPDTTAPRQQDRRATPAPPTPATAATTAAGGGNNAAEVDGGPVRFGADRPRTLTEALRRAATTGRGTVYLDAHGEADRQSYADLLTEAQRVLGGLRAAGLRPGDAALFQFDQARNYVTTFWACVLGGFLPTPVAVAPSYQRHNAVTRRLHNAWRLLECPVLLTDAATRPRLDGLGQLWDEPGVRVLATEELAGSAPDPRWHRSAVDTPALHLLTSGSTGVPKCVRHTHASVAARTWAVADACGYGPDDVTMNWMPLDHVAIVMYNVRDVFLGAEHVNARIDSILADPLAWFDWIDRYRATNSWAPNFAYAMVNERAQEIAHRHWDLSCVRELTNAGEPVIARTAHRFLDLLAPHGLPGTVIRPCWGMSETCSGVTYDRLERTDPSRGTVTVDQASLPGALREVPPGHPDAVVFTQVGPPVPGIRLRIVGPDGAVLPADRIGRLQVTGAVVMPGYHRNPDANAEAYTADGWFDTGDLAFLHDGSLVITGRAKDQIIVRGVNYLAHEIEAAVEQVAGVRVSYVAAGALPAPDQGSDQLAVFFVPEGADPHDGRMAGVVAEIRARLVRDVGLSPDFVLAVSVEEFPKTGSGKIQRGQLVAELRAGTFAERLAGAGTEPDLVDSMFTRAWVPVPAPRPDGGRPRRWLVFTSEPRRWRDLPGAVVTVGQPPTTERGYAALLAEVAPDVVVHAWGTAPLPADTTADLDSALARTAYPLVRLLRASTGSQLPVLLVTTGAVATGSDTAAEPAKGGLAALLRTAAQEQPGRLLRHLDLPADAPQSWPATVSAEALMPGGDSVVAYRHGVRLAPRLAPVPADEQRPALPAGGRYLLTGGLGGIGFEVAQYLLAAYQMRLLIVGRHPDPERLAQLASLGSIRFAPLDVADAGTLRAAVSDAETAWGAPLDGVLHLAGAAAGDAWRDVAAHTVEREALDSYRRAYRAKLYGTHALVDLLRERPDTDLVLFSSVNGQFGGVGFGAYSSANGYLDAFAGHRRAQGGRACALAWSMWRDLGMNQGTATAMAGSRGYRAIDPDDGVRALLAALATGRPYLLIGLDPANPHVLAAIAPDELAPGEIVLAYAAADPAAGERLRRALPADAGPVRLVRVDDPDELDGDRERLRARLTRGRPAPRYAPPATGLERQLADIWAQVLGRHRVGRDETFFELGGSSLQAAQVVARVNASLAADLAVEQLYEHPTVEVLAGALGRQRREEHVDDQ